MRREPGTRLIFIFILTVILSGGILTYLSINSISNFKELTEKKISEEQKSVVDRVSFHIQDRIDETAIRFTVFLLGEEREERIDWLTLDAYDMLDASETLDFVEHPFVVSGEGEFLWPRFLDGPAEYQEKLQSIPFQQEFRRAEIAEFQEKDFKKAVIHYQASLKHSSGKTDSVTVLNALGRLYQKSNDFDKAFICFATINSGYSSVLDNNGFPYVYYAILNLMRSTDSTFRSRIFPEIEAFLHGLSTGIIPINNSTGDILIQVNNWVNRPGVANEIQNSKLAEHNRKIHKKIDFIDRFSSPIRESLEQDYGDQYGLVAEKFHVIGGMQEKAEEIILTAPSGDLSVGFVIELNQIWSASMNSGYIGQTEFEYDIELIRKEALKGEDSDVMSSVFEFSMLFPHHLVRVSLKDNNMVDILVKRRSWTYGIALFLLLGAMSMGILLILRDILREKHLGQLRSDFVSNVSHELKTPLTSIHLFAESVLLDRVTTESGQKEYLKIILKETERLKRMINNILDFSKKERGKLDYKTENVDVTSLILSALKDLNYWLVEMNFRVHTQLEEGIHVAGDHDALKKVVINLLDNAIKYSGNQKEISIRLVTENSKIRIEFSDKGIGIPENQLDTIFEKFFRVNDTMVDGVGGTGLGLTVVKEIVEAHHGKILVESELNKGSKFTVLLTSS